MAATEFPFGIVIAVVVALAVAAWLLKVGVVKKGPEFECSVCGRKQSGMHASQWRFCPYCGTPRPRPPRIPGLNL
ncbi:MAG: hypothetical protein HY903_25160 [Deltaproteobacteria bacterium]|nr:hypothetical protein [Deltaproteobacteria bacterium]